MGGGRVDRTPVTNCQRALMQIWINPVWFCILVYAGRQCKSPDQPFWRSLSGVTAGVIATTATHPLDVVGARITIQIGLFENYGRLILKKE